MPELVFNKLILHIVTGTICLVLALILVLFTPFKEVAILPSVLLLSVLYNGLTFYVSYKNGRVFFIKATCIEKNDYKESLIQRINSMSNKNRKLYEYKMKSDDEGNETFYVVLPERDKMKEDIHYIMMFYKNDEGFVDESNLIKIAELPTLQKE